MPTKTSEPSPAEKPTVFLSYSRKDKRWLGELRTMLAPLVRNSLVDVWWAAAEADLSEALEIAERGSMRLHECDAHLEWARLCRQRGDRDGLQRHVARARRLVEETGYGRRRREVEWLERQLG